MTTNETSVSQEYKELADIASGMLSSSQIKIYFNHGFLVTNYNLDLLKGATYDMCLGSPAYRFVDNGKCIFHLAKKANTTEKIKDRLIFPPNSLTFVTTQEEFKLTKDVIARFNLKSKWVHKGLLLGTGPIVDPEFEGPLYIPIHNFSSKPVDIAFGSPLIAVEFTKTLPVNDNYIENPSKKGSIKQYLDNAGDVESSVYKTIHIFNKTNKKQNRFLTWGAVGAAVATIAVCVSIYTLISSIDARIDNFHSAYGGEDYKKTFNDMNNKFQSLQNEYTAVIPHIRSKINEISSEQSIAISSLQKEIEQIASDLKAIKQQDTNKVKNHAVP